MVENNTGHYVWQTTVREVGKTADLSEEEGVKAD